MSAEGTPHHEYSDGIRDIVQVVRWFAIDESVRLHAAGRIPEVWIIHAYPTDLDIAKYRRIGAAIKEMEAPRDVLVARAANERPPSARAELARRLG